MSRWTSPKSQIGRVATWAGVALGWVGTASVSLAQPQPAPLPVAPAPAAAPAKTPLTLSLPECLSIALAKHPAMEMGRLSLINAEKGYQSLFNLPAVASLARPDLPIRKEQGLRGIAVAQADLVKTEQEVTNDVCRLYYTYIYAHQQEGIANEIVTQLENYLAIVRDILKQPPNPSNPLKITKVTEDQILIGLGTAKQKLLLAQSGKLAASAALAQAMGLDPADSPVVPKDKELPLIEGAVTQEQIVQWAMTRRPELQMAAAGVDAFRLEVCAQDKNRFGLQVGTLAQASDLHARATPTALRNGEYRPGLAPLEMPLSLAGKREDRVARAIDLSRRQDLLYEQVVSLIKLEAINSYLNWKRTTDQLAEAKIRFNAGKELNNLLKQNTGNLTQEQLLQNSVAAGLAQSDYLEAVYEHVKALIALERVTAGAARTGFPGR